MLESSMVSAAGCFNQIEPVRRKFFTKIYQIIGLEPKYKAKRNLMVMNDLIWRKNVYWTHCFHSKTYQKLKKIHNVW